MAEGDFIARTASIGTGGAGQRAITTTDAALDWETAIFASPGTFTVQNSDKEVKVNEAGRFLVRYDAGVAQNPNVARPTRAMVHGTVRKNGTALASGRSSAYWRAAQAATRGHLAAGAILDLAANDVLSIFAQRIDTAGAGGSTIRDNGVEGSIGVLRLRSAWKLYSAHLSADGSASSTSWASLDFDTEDTVETGFGTEGSDVTFDYQAAGGDYDVPEPRRFYLVAVCMEFASSSTTTPLEMEMRVRYSDGSGISRTFNLRAVVSSYCEGVGGTTKPTCSFLGIVVGGSGEPTDDTDALRFEYRNRTTNGTTGTPKADKCSLQVCAIPAAHLDLWHGIDSAGQDGDADAAVGKDLEVYDGGESWQHNPSGSDDSEVRALGYGLWAIAFATISSAPSGARNANRIVHQLSLRVEGATATYGCAIAWDRGSTDGADGASCAAHSIVHLAGDEDLTAYHDDLNAQTDTVADLEGGQTNALFVWVLKYDAIRPSPVTMPLAAPAVARRVELVPAAVTMPLVVPAVARRVELVASAVAMPWVVAAVARRVELVPQPVPMPWLVATPLVFYARTPDPVPMPWVVAAVARRVELVPAAVTMPWVVPAVTLPGFQNPQPVAMPWVVAAVARRVELVPAAVPMPWVVAQVARRLELEPAAVTMPWVVAAPLLRAVLVPQPVPMPWLVGQVTRALELVPAALQLVWIVETVARRVEVTPAAVAMPWVVAGTGFYLSETPDPVPMPWAVAAPALGLDLLPQPVPMPWAVAQVARRLELEPAAVAMPWTVGEVARRLELVPQPVPMPWTVGDVRVAVLLLLELRAALRRALELEPALAQALELRPAAARAGALAARLAQGLELRSSAGAQAALEALLRGSLDVRSELEVLAELRPGARTALEIPAALGPLLEAAAELRAAAELELGAGARLETRGGLP